MLLNTKYPPSKSIKAFTLVELSIVIVVIGLIVAGVSVGQTLVRQAGLRSVMTDINSLKSAVIQFKTIYNALPGDMPNAYTYWGTAAGCTNNVVSSVSSGCNGNGDGYIAAWWDEGFRAPQHLTRAGLISGSYDASGIGVGCTGNTCIRSKISQGYLLFAPFLNSYGTNGNVIQFGSPTSGGTNPCLGVITPREAQAIDTKIDDGIATKGWLFTVISCAGQPTDGTKCVTADVSAATADWVLTDTTKSCRVVYWLTKR